MKHVHMGVSNSRILLEKAGRKSGKAVDGDAKTKSRQELTLVTCGLQN